MTANSIRVVRARKPHRCMAGQGHHIRAGQLYVRTVAFPGHDAHPGTGGPLVGALCTQCAELYTTTAGLIAARLAKGGNVPTRRQVPDYLRRLHQMAYRSRNTAGWTFWGLAAVESLWPVPGPTDEYEFVWLTRPAGKGVLYKALIELDTGLIIRSRPHRAGDG